MIKVNLTVPDIPEVCPPREGMVIEIDKIFWDLLILI
jgi:hypothetical protein